MPQAPVISEASVGTGEIIVKWSSVGCDQTGHIVYRKSGDCGSADPWAEMARVAKAAVSYNDGSAVSGGIILICSEGLPNVLASPCRYGYSLESDCVSATAP